MGVICTDEWMDEHFFQPAELCKLASPETKNHTNFYHYLKQFGMYHPSKRTFDMFTELKEKKTWKQIDKLHSKYKSMWKAPDTDIYIFPVQPSQPFMRELKGRSGVTFPGKIFLFLSPVEDITLWESLFVHEYHHAVRMKMYNKDTSDYHLLDSLVFEGLAEQAVLKYCGKEYTEWMNLYERELLQHYWERHYKNQLDIKKSHPVHDDLLFGRRGVPKMLGYAIGSALVKGYKGKTPLTVHQSFSLPSEKILSDNNLFNIHLEASD